MRAVLTLFVGCSLALQPQPTPKAMFYNPAGVGEVESTTYLTWRTPRVREVNYVTPLRQCGIHYWFEDSAGAMASESQARSRSAPQKLFVRASCNGFLTVFDIDTGAELTPRTYERYSGLQLGDAIFHVPGAFALDPTSTRRVIIVWARSQTEVAGDAATAPTRMQQLLKWNDIVRASEEKQAGEIGNYVVNRADAGVAVEILFTNR